MIFQLRIILKEVYSTAGLTIDSKIIYLRYALRRLHLVNNYLYVYIKISLHDNFTCRHTLLYGLTVLEELF